MTALPHDRYIQAVLSALSDAGFVPDRWEIETPDGERLDAVMCWDRTHTALDANEWPYGVLICWSQLEGWEYAAVKADGFNSYPRELLHEFIAAPQSVVEAVALLMRGTDGVPMHGRSWVHKAELERALQAWDDDIS